MNQKLFAASLLILALMPCSVYAHGNNAHIWVTDKAADALPDGELKTFLADPDVRNAILMGSNFPDYGYAVNAAFGEPAHWEPFAVAAINWLRGNGYVPADTQEKKKVVAFFMGAVCHGMEDEVFDSLMVPNAVENDGAAVENDLDMATDCFLIAYRKVKPNPEKYLPYTEAIAILATMGISTSSDELKAGMDKTIDYAVSGLQAIAAGMADSYKKQMPWVARHFTDPDAAGSFTMETAVTAEFLPYLWQRFHGTSDGDAPFVGIYPSAGIPFASLEAGKVGSWMTVFAGIGLDDPDINTNRIKLSSGGSQLASEVLRTHWSSGTGSSRLFIVKPAASLTPDTDYTVSVAKGMGLTDGRTISKDNDIQFSTGTGSPDGGFDDGGVDSGAADGGQNAPSAGCSCSILNL